MIRTKDNRNVPVAADPYALARDRATDQSNDVTRATLGLEDNPTLNLGEQVATQPGRVETTVGRPGRWREGPVVMQERRLDVMPMPAIGEGTINRNIRYPQNATPVPAYFSWAANRQIVDSGVEPAAIEPSRVDEYYLSSTWLGITDPAAWVVTGDRPQPGLEPFQSRPGIMGQPSTGWPVVGPEIPSYGSRVPLLRPRTLIEGAV